SQDRRTAAPSFFDDAKDLLARDEGAHCVVHGHEFGIARNLIESSRYRFLPGIAAAHDANFLAQLFCSDALLQFSDSVRTSSHDNVSDQIACRNPPHA